ncbi:MAG: thioredoxin family protein [Acidobacteriota bacterium]|nr:thioredoxin family protein [Acidobacteriota bacterium]
MLLALLLLLTSAATAQAPAYVELFDRGQAFDAFFDSISARRESWSATQAAADVPDAIAARARALSRTWRILAIAEDRCSDSAASLPYVAKLAAAAPGRLSLRIVDARAGRAAMEAHRTPDGRAATPTLIFIRDDGEIRAWIERPGALVAWISEQKARDPKFDVLAGKTKWYADDAGRSTLADILTLLER